MDAALQLLELRGPDACALSAQTMDGGGLTALALEVALAPGSQRSRLVSALLHAGASPDAPDSSGDTVLMRCLRAGTTTLALQLLPHCTHLCAANAAGEEALSLVLSMRQALLGRAMCGNSAGGCDLQSPAGPAAGGSSCSCALLKSSGGAASNAAASALSSGDNSCSSPSPGVHLGRVGQLQPHSGPGRGSSGGAIMISGSRAQDANATSSKSSSRKPAGSMLQVCSGHAGAGGSLLSSTAARTPPSKWPEVTAARTVGRGQVLASHASTAAATTGSSAMARPVKSVGIAAAAAAIKNSSGAAAASSAGVKSRPDKGQMPGCKSGTIQGGAAAAMAAAQCTAVEENEGCSAAMLQAVLVTLLQRGAQLTPVAGAQLLKEAWAPADDKLCALVSC